MVGMDLEHVTQVQKELAVKDAARQTGGYRYWSPKSGNNQVRILPPWTGEGKNARRFYREIYLHWNIGDGQNTTTFTCQKWTPDLEGECPVCSYVEKLRATEDPADAEAAQEMAARPSYYSNIVDLQDPVFTQENYDTAVIKAKSKGGDVPFAVGDTKVQLFRYGPMIFNMIIGVVSNLKEDVTSTDTGRHLTVTKTGSGRTGTKYQVMPNDRSPMVFVGGEISQRLYNIDTISKPRTLQEMESALPGAQHAAPPTMPAASPEPQAALPAPVEPPTNNTNTEAEEEPPECFKDADIFDQNDAECVGGTTDVGAFDPCPFFQACGTAVGVLKVKSKRTKRKPKAAVSNMTPAAADLEKQLLAYANK